MVASSGKYGIYSYIKANPLATYTEFRHIEGEQLLIETRDIRLEFCVLFTRVRRDIASQGVTVTNFLLFLKKLPGYAGKSLFDSYFSKINEESKLIEVFEVVADHCSWFNHSILERMVGSFCKGNGKIKMVHKEYCTHLQKYCKHRVKKMPHFMHKNGFGSGGNKDAKMVMMVDREWNGIRIEQLEEVVINISQILIVPRYLIKLSSVEHGCVQLTMLVPSYFPDAVFPLTAEQEAAMKEMGVTDLQCGSYHFYFQVRTQNKPLSLALVLG